MWLVSASILRTRRRAPEQVMLMTSMHATVLNDCGCILQFWAHFVGGLRLRLLGCVVWFTVRLAATCLVMRQLVRRENASPDPDLAGACTACSCGGRCLRRARAPRARRGQLQRVCDGRVACTVVGPVAVGCSWARFTVILRSRKILSPYCPTGAATRRGAVY